MDHLALQDGILFISVLFLQISFISYWLKHNKNGSFITKYIPITIMTILCIYILKTYTGGFQ